MSRISIFKPKDENDIKLAFEGKINLNQSQRQQDIEEDFRPRRRRMERMERKERRERRRTRIIFDDFDDITEHRFPDHRFPYHRAIRRHNFYCFPLIIQKIKFFIIYLLCGNIFILINIFKSDLYAKLASYFIISSILLIHIPLFFFQIIINFISIIPYILSHVLRI